MKITKNKYEEICKKIANYINTGVYDFDPNCSDYEEMCVEHYLSAMIDYRFTTNSKKQYIGAIMLVAVEGVSVTINTLDKSISGYAGSDKVKLYYTKDNLGICNHMAKLFQSI